MENTNLPAVVGIIGRSGSGKTTLIEKLIPCLRERGLRLAVVKHTSHRHELDRPGKDSHRMRQAGAEVVLVSSPQMFALFRNVRQELSLEEILAHVPLQIDLILAEGYKQFGYPAIEIYRPPVSDVLLAPSNKQVFAIVTASAIQAPVPCYKPDDINEIAACIVRQCRLRRPQ